MKKTNTVRVNGNMIFKGQKLTLGMDLGDHWSCYCVLDEAGKIILEQKVAMTPEAMKQTSQANWLVPDKRSRNRKLGVLGGPFRFPKSVRSCPCFFD